MAPSFLEDSLEMTPAERSKSSVLVVEPDSHERNNMRTALKNLGFGSISDVPNHHAALEKLEQRQFTHIIFDAKKTNMPVDEFLKKCLEGNNETVCIPASFEPSVDDVFELLIIGAKGYLCKPFTGETVDAAIINATKGEPISDVVLKAKDRNQALIAIVMQALDKTATIMRQARQFETAGRELPKQLRGFQRSAELAHTFVKDGQDGFIAALQQFCIDRSKGPATRLGRLRKRLKNKPKDEEASA